MPTRKNQPHNRERRQKDAQERQEARAKRSSQEQLERLDAKLGEGQGAKRERERLLKPDQKSGGEQEPQKLDNE